MTNVYIEVKNHATAFEEYVVEDHANSVLKGGFKTQLEAILWAKAAGHKPLVARVRHMNNKNVPDHWRAA